MRKYILLFLMMVMAAVSYGSRVYDMPVTITQSDGTRLTVIGHGDEFFHWYTTTDGVLLYHEGRDYFIATMDDEGTLGNSRVLAHEAGKRSEQEQTLIKAQNMELFLTAANHTSALRRSRYYEPVGNNGKDTHLMPHLGSPVVPVILVEFSDSSFSLPNPRLSFDEYLNSETKLVNRGNREDRNYGSVRKYFQDMSYGAFSPSFKIYGPIRVPHKMSYYGGTNAAGTDEAAAQLVKDACTMVNDSVDFSQFDYDNDGYIDLVYVIHAGYTQSITGVPSENIWSRSGSSGGGNFDGKSFYRWGVSSELNGYPGAFTSAPYKRINGIGLFCHEFSHTMGLPDFYPTEKTARGNNQAMERWDLMDAGEYTDNGYAPTPYTAWEREALGWMQIDTLTNNGVYNLASLGKEGKAWKLMNPHEEKEYWVFQNCGIDNWYSKGYGLGLLVYHVSYDSDAFSLYGNYVNNTKGQPRMTVVPADSLLLNDSYVNTLAEYAAGMAGDVFPGSKKVTTLSNETHKDYGYFPYQIELPLSAVFSNITIQGNTDVTFRVSGLVETLGDIDGNREVNTSDVTALYNVIFGTDTTTPIGICNVDGSEDEQPNTSDVTALYNIIFGTSAK